MKLFSKLLFCFCIFVQFSILDSFSAANFRQNTLNTLVIRDSGKTHKRDIRSSNGYANGTKFGEDVILSGTGTINLTLASTKLVFEVCSNCAGTSSVCYKSLNGFDNSKAVGSCRRFSSCEFKVKDDDDAIKFGENSIYKTDFTGCLQTTMEYPSAKVKDLGRFPSCDPKKVDDDIIELYVSISPSCSIIVKDAKVHEPPTTTSTKVPPPTQSSQKDSAEASSFPDWGYAIIGIVILIVIAAIIGCIAYYLCKKHQASKRILPSVAETKPNAIVSRADVAAETPTKKNDDLEAAKVEPTQIPKKEKKTKTQEPTTVEDVPPPIQKPKKEKKPKILESKTTEEVPAPTQQESTAQEPLPPTAKLPPRTRSSYPEVKRLIPRGMKSAKTDSLDETLKKDKTAMVESLVVSTGKHCLKADETDFLRKMKAAYPENVQHVVLPSEIKLLCLPVSKMFEKMDSMAQVSELKLSSAGCEFDERGCMVSISKDARQFLKEKTTDATTVYLAFGAEFHEYITGDLGIMDEASIPLLYSTALQTRFPEATRRKACAILRRKLVKVLGYFKAADRAKMPFPVNIVENAYCHDPKYFYDPSAIKTDSGSDEKEKRIGDEKRNKKLS